ncbi:MAG: undecaprenyl-diphosphate phosphatase [Nanoarchaeota archaeon]
MNNFISVLILAIVQGITEWLPISSSGHLVLFERLLDYKAGLMFDVALHFGSLMAVFVYFGKEITNILESFFKFDFKSENGKFGLLILVASIPAGIIGLLFKRLFEEAFSSLLLVALGFAVTGVFLLIASLDIGTEKKELNFYDSFLVGIAQAVAIFPGISRSGATISSGMLLGLSPKEAAKFSFLMTIPAIFGASLVTIGNNPLPHEMIWATFVSFIVSLAVMHFLFKLVLSSRKNFRWFGAYTLLLAIVLGLYLAFF